MGIWKQSVHHEIEINRSTEEVRAVFLDFDSYPEWQDYWTWELNDSSKSPGELRPGDRLENIYLGSSVDCAIVVNSSESFQVLGSLGPFLKGHHQVYFEPSKVIQGGTKLIIHEDFIGLLSFVMRRGTRFRESLDNSFEGFNSKLNQRMEST